MSDASSLVGSRVGRAISVVILRLFFLLAILVGIVSIVGDTVEISTTLARGHIPLTLTLDKALPSAATNCHGCAITGNFATANIDVSGLSSQVTTFAVAAAIASMLTEVALCALIAILAWRLLHRALFRRALANAVGAGGTVLGVGGLVSQAGIAMAGVRAASEINDRGTGYWPLEATFDPTIPIVGVVLLLVALAFEYGTRLQKETEGLV